ncbi:MAG: hypothetical protein M3Y31_01975 [Gemmatimonadota bacterium]|nr:hypothetical protein [Gemmatimonadota bacterium]
MGTEWIALGTALTLGLLHALELDHMLAVTTFVSRRPAPRAAAWFGARWGIGHSLAVLAAGGVLLLSGVRWPERWDSAAEALVGIVLIGLGVWAIASARKLHLHSVEEHGGHAHLHVHAAAREPHLHRHADAAEASRPHDHGAVTLVGLLHGLAGTSAVVALVPVTLADRVAVGLGYLTAFGIGVTVAMTLFALVAALAVRNASARSLDAGRWVTRMVGVAGMVVGVFWVVRAVS